MKWPDWLRSPRIATTSRPVTLPARRWTAGRKGTPRTRLGVESLDDRILLSHFRYATLTWEPVAGNTVEMHLQAAFRSDGYGAVSVGSVFSETIGGTSINFGDTSSTGTLSFRVLSINTTDGYLLAEAVRSVGPGVWDEGVLHTYASATNYTAFMQGTVRISNLKNNANGTYRLQTTVNVGAGNAPPVSSLAPIVQMPDNAVGTFQMPAADPDTGDVLTYRLASNAEAAFIDQPRGLTVSGSGLVRWDIRDGVLATVPGDLWSAQVIVEDHVGSAGSPVKSQTAVDFILKIAQSAGVNSPPTVSANPTGPFRPVANTTLTFNVTATDPDGTVTALQALNPPAGMTFGAFGSPAATKTITATWTPTQAQANQTLLVTFQATDNGGATAQTSITLTPGTNQAPVANADAYSLNEDTTLSVSAPGVLANDTDAENNPFTATLVAGTTHGTLAFNGNGSFSYTPTANFNGTDTFTYRASDATGTGNTATVIITVKPVNDPPVSRGDGYTTDEDTPLAIAGPGVLANDTDIEGDPLSAILIAGPAHGSLILGVNGSFTYTPAGDYNGSDSFTYKANDGTADSGVATVNLTIIAVNDAPVVNNDTATTDEDTAVNIPVLANDLPGPADERTQTLTVTKLNGMTVLAGQAMATAHGSVLLNADGTVTYTPAVDYNGPDHFSYEATDNGIPPLSASASGTVTINPVNDAPVAASDSYTIAEDGTLTVPAVGVLANDNDADGDPLSVAAPRPITTPSHGNVTMYADGSFTYAPFANYNGTDTFRYKAFDGIADSNLATVTMTITPVNDAPVANHDSAITDEDRGVVIPVLANDIDVDGTVNPAGVVITSGPAHGSLNINTITGDVTYTPEPDYNGPDGFRYTVTDDSGAVSREASVTITVSPVNDMPIAGADTYTTDEDTTLEVAAGVLGNDTDADHDPLTSILVSPSVHGAVILHSDGSFKYTPNSNYNGPDRFTYKAFDGILNSAVVVVNIVVNPVNDPPTATADNDDDVLVDEGMTAINTGTFGDLDADDVVKVTASIGHLTQDPNGTWSWSYDANDGPDESQTVVITADDGNGGLATATFELVARNVPPTATMVNGGPLDEGGWVTIRLDDPYDPGGVDTAAGLRYSFASAAGGLAATYASAASARFAFDDDGSYTIYGRVFDKDGGYSDYRTDVTVVNVAPTLTISGNPAIDEGATYLLGLASSDPGADTITRWTIDWGDGSPVQTLTGNPGSVTHIYADGPSVYTIIAAATDEDGTYRSNILGVTVANVAPTARIQSVELAEDSTRTIALSAWDPGVNDAFTYIIVGLPDYGILSQLSGPGGVLYAYTPYANYHGPDRFAFKVYDGTADGNTATVSIVVTAVEDAPVAVNDAATILEDAPDTAIGVLFNDFDVDNLGGPANAGLKVTSVGIASHGTVWLDPSSGQVRYRPGADYYGSDTFSYTIGDPSGRTSTGMVAVTVTGVNDAPLVNMPGGQNVNNDTNLIISGVSATDVDAGDAPITVTLGVGNAILNVSSSVIGGLGPGGIGGNGTRGITLYGTLAQINRTLAAGMTYKGLLNYYGPDSLKVAVNDGGNTGLGGPLDAGMTVAVTVRNANNLVEAGQAATIGFWANSNGRNVITALGRDSMGASLVGKWLAAQFPNLFTGLSTSTPDGVWNRFRSLFDTRNPIEGASKLEAQVMATALSVYVTDATNLNTTAIGQSVAAKYNFTRNPLAARSWSLTLEQAAALGLARGAERYTIRELLKAANSKAVTGRLFSTNAINRTLVYQAFEPINRIGSISRLA